MCLNPLFSCTAFHPAMTGGEFALFVSMGISLVHGWLVDPMSPKHAAVSHVEGYNSAVNLIIKADVLTHGLLMGADADQDDADDVGPSKARLSHSNVDLTDEERRKVEGW
jgi:ubiquitin carboxyl-terminal hydrolase MINDY-1/2